MMTSSTRWQLLSLVFQSALIIALGLAVYSWRQPLTPTDKLDKIEEELRATQAQIEETKMSLLEKIEQERQEKVRKIYVQAETQIIDLGRRPEKVSRGLADLAASGRAERARQTQTSTAVR